MAHTLSIYDGVEATTLALAGTAATGYSLQRYASAPPEQSQQRNGSLYLDGSRPIFTRRENIVETITIEVHGSSRDDLFIKLRALHRAFRHALDFMQNPGVRNPVYLIYKPDSATNTSYSAILGGRVDAPELDAEVEEGEGSEGDLLSNIIGGVVLTIEREPFWRKYAPQGGADDVIVAGTTTSVCWGEFDVASTPGDEPAPIHLALTAVGGIDRLIIGYKSEAAAGAGIDDNFGLTEAEGGTRGTDATLATDATASPGGAGNTKITVSFATATDAERLTFAENLPLWSAARVFVRCKLSAAGTVSLYCKAQASTGGAKFSNGAVSITHTAWRMIDLGVIFIPYGGTRNYGTPDGATNIILSASRSAGACALEIDFAYLMPVDEGYISISGAATVDANQAVEFDNISPLGPFAGSFLMERPFANALWTGDLRILPGNGTIYYLAGDANFANTFAGAGANFGWSIACVPCYSAARGNG